MIEVASRQEARAHIDANPGDTVLDRSTGHVWTAVATMVPVREGYLVYGDHGLDAAGSVKRSGKKWVAMRYGNGVATRGTLAAAAAALIAAAE